MKFAFVPVTDDNLRDYMAIGVRSYREHYLHLWQNNDPSPFIEAHLTEEAVDKALNDPLSHLYIISFEGMKVGILKITQNVHHEPAIPKNNLLLNKIYLLKRFSGKGIGSTTLAFVHDLAKEQDKEMVWLFAMKKGKAVDFYKSHGYTIIRETTLNLPSVLPSEKEMWIMARKP